MGKDARRRDDPYEVLGVRLEASRDDIVRAYRRAALHSHPDTLPADSQAAGRFQAVTEAYELLIDSRRRSEYDRSRSRQPTPPPDAPPVPSAGHQAGSWPAPPLWAGPVHVQPHAQQPGAQQAGAQQPAAQQPYPQQAGSNAWHQPEDPADEYGLLEWYLNRFWGWP